MSIFIIGEVGINHNGDLELAKELIKLAKNAGCNAVKFQKRDVYSVYSKEFLASPRESPWGSTQLDQKLGLELSKQDFDEIDNYCRDINIIWFASAWDLNSQDFLASYNLKYNKIASAMLTNLPLLHAVAKEKKHTFVSTGMSNYSDIDAAVSIFRSHSCPFELMHAVSTYPMRDEDANLNVIKTLKSRYNCSVGYSGHEVGLAVSYAASALGISSLERHITLDRAMYGSDQSASLGPEGLYKLVGGIRKIELALGDGEKKVISDEVEIAKKLRQHIPLEANT